MRTGLLVKLLLFCGLISGLRAASVVGIVSAVDGNWVDSAGDEVTRGYLVTTDSSLKVSGQSNATGSLQIRSVVNGELVTFDCSKLSCDKEIDLRPVTQKAGNSNDFLNTVNETLKDLAGSQVHSVAGYARALPKGPHGQITDGVVVFGADGVDLKPVFEGMEPGVIELEFCRVGEKGSAACPPQSARTSWNWIPAKPVRLQAKSLNRGLYEIGAYRQDTNGIAKIRESAWVLLVPASDYDSAKTKYQTAVLQTDKWSGSEQRMFRRLYLRGLASNH